MPKHVFHFSAVGTKLRNSAYDDRHVHKHKGSNREPEQIVSWVLERDGATAATEWRGRLGWNESLSDGNVM